MSAAYLVLYEGRPSDPDAFLRYYVEQHVPLVWKFPGIRDVAIELGHDGGDFFMVVRLVFDDLPTLRTAITSAARERARADMQDHFPPFEGRVRHQVTETHPVSADGCKLRSGVVSGRQDRPATPASPASTPRSGRRHDCPPPHPQV